MHKDENAQGQTAQPVDLDSVKREAVEWYIKKFDNTGVIGMPSDREVLFDYIDHLASRGMIGDNYVVIETPNGIASGKTKEEALGKIILGSKQPTEDAQRALDDFNRGMTAWMRPERRIALISKHADTIRAALARGLGE